MSPNELLNFALTYSHYDALTNIQYTEPHYYRKVLEKTDEYEVVLVCFTKRQSTSLHDHGGSHCVVKCLRGKYHETAYLLDEDGTLVYIGNLIQSAGEIAHVTDDHIHQVTNMDPRGTVLLNFYTPPLPPL